MECVWRVLKPSTGGNGGRETPADDGLGLELAEGTRQTSQPGKQESGGVWPSLMHPSLTLRL